MLVHSLKTPPQGAFAASLKGGGVHVDNIATCFVPHPSLTHNTSNSIELQFCNPPKNLFDKLQLLLCFGPFHYIQNSSVQDSHKTVPVI